MPGLPDKLGSAIRHFRFASQDEEIDVLAKLGRAVEHASLAAQLDRGVGRDPTFDIDLETPRKPSIFPVVVMTTAADCMEIPCRRECRWLVLAYLWGAVVLGGSGVLMLYSQTPGEASRVVPTSWPTASHLPLAPDGATLVMFAHPKCPCTRASIGELDILMARVQGKVKTRVVFFSPEGVDENWAETDLWRSAAAIPGVEVQLDVDGHEAREFHASTSGHVVLYDSKGQLLFRGGITEARGHSGDNAGRGAITDLLQHGQTSRDATPTFGCPLQEPAPQPLSRPPSTDS